MPVTKLTMKRLVDIPDHTHLPANWKAQEIVLARLAYYTDSQGRLNFRFSQLNYYKISDVAVFLNLLKKGALPSPLPPATSNSHVNPLEIPVRTWCHVVVTFEDGMPIRFRAGGPAITSKEDYHSDNCDLRHFASDLTPLPSTPGEGCQFASFSVANRGKDEHQLFNLHLELEQDGQRGWLEVALDPDVPDDGGTIPPFIDPFTGEAPANLEPGPPVARPAWRKFRGGDEA